MTTIEDKISLFSKIIYDKLNEEKEERLKAFEEEALRKMNEEKEKIEELKKIALIDVTKKANIKANEIVAKEKLNKQREVLALKDNLVKFTIEEVKNKLKVYVKGEEYKKYFNNLLEKALKDIENGDYNIIVLKSDYDRFKNDIGTAISSYRDKKVNLSISEDDFIGGIILKDVQGRFKIDYSIAKKLEESEELVGVRVMEMLA